MYSRMTSLRPVLHRSAARPYGAADDRSLPGDALEWSWPPYAPLAVDDQRFDTAGWAPSSVVWHPQLRLGRWTVVYRRAAG